MVASYRRWLSLVTVCSLWSSAAIADDWKYTIEGGAGVIPRYSGSDEYAAVPLIGLGVSTPSGFFLNTDKGLGWGMDSGAVAFATFLNASPTRRDHRTALQGSDRLRGMGSIKTRPLLGVDASFKAGSAQFTATLLHALKDDEKGEYERDYSALRLGVGTELGSVAGGLLRGMVLTDIGDDHYLRTWYGVSAAQAARTRYTAYRPDAGLVDVGASLSWAVPISNHVSTGVSFEALRLLGDAADSPLVRQRTQFSLGAVISYTY